MNAPLHWRDPVVAEIHEIRDELAREFEGDLTAYSDAALAHCQRLNLQFAVLTVSLPEAGQQSTVGDDMYSTRLRPSP
jgi:hypothetical protein